MQDAPKDVAVFSEGDVTCQGALTYNWSSLPPLPVHPPGRTTALPKHRPLLVSALYILIEAQVLCPYYCVLHAVRHNSWPEAHLKGDAHTEHHRHRWLP